MISNIDISESRKIPLPSFNETDARNMHNKGWSFSYVYNFTEIRDVYIALRSNEFVNLQEFTKYCLRMVNLSGDLRICPIF